MYIQINNLELLKNKLILQGTISYKEPTNNPKQLFIKCNDEIIISDSFYRINQNKKIFQYRFQFSITLANLRTKYYIYIFYYQDNIEKICAMDSFHYFCPISKKYSKSYFSSSNWLLSYDKNAYIIVPRTLPYHIIYEYKFCKQLALDKHYEDIIIRQLITLIRHFQRKEIWILYDRICRADDNAEAFFEYLQKFNDTKIHTYFLLDKCSHDYKRLKKKGKVIPFFSFREKILFLLCKYKISSQADHYTTYPMGENNYSFQDLLQRSKFIFLQHGVIKDDLSNWLNYYNRKILGFVTSAQEEANSILSLPYEYNKNQIWLTGLPRFDKLYHKEQKLITIMPTWRKYLMENEYTIQGIRKLKTDFKHSEFYKAYDALLSSPILEQFLKEKGYSLGFMPHPMMEPYIDQFPKHRNVHYFSSKERYQDIFAFSNLIITDYSSAVFDFALLKKPIIYYQFDFDKFFSGAHTFKQGYFDYNQMAFGEVITNVEQVIQAIMQYISNNCEMPPLYQKRVNDFFKYRDQNNCARLYAQIKSYENEMLKDNMELSFINAH